MQKDSSILDQIRSLKDSVNSLSQKISEIERKQTASITFQVTASLSTELLYSKNIEMSTNKEYRGYVRFPLEEVPHYISHSAGVDVLIISKDSFIDILTETILSTVVEKEMQDKEVSSLRESFMIKTIVVTGGTDTLSRPVKFVE